MDAPSSQPSSDLAAPAPGRGFDVGGTRPDAGLSPTLVWLFEGRGYTQVVVAADALLLIVALVLADTLNPAPSYLAALLVSPLTVLLLAARRLYDPHAQIARLDRVAAILGASAIAAVLVAGFVELVRPEAVDAGLIAIQFGLGTALLLVWSTASRPLGSGRADPVARAAGARGRLRDANPPL